MPCVGSRMGVVGGGGEVDCNMFEVCSVNVRRYASPPSRSIISFQLLVMSSKL